MNLLYRLPEVFAPPLEPLQGKGAGFCLWTPTSNFKSVFVTGQNVSVTSCSTAGPKDLKEQLTEGSLPLPASSLGFFFFF